MVKRMFEDRHITFHNSCRVSKHDTYNGNRCYLACASNLARVCHGKSWPLPLTLIERLCNLRQVRKVDFRFRDLVLDEGDAFVFPGTLFVVSFDIGYFASAQLVVMNQWIAVTENAVRLHCVPLNESSQFCD